METVEEEEAAEEDEGPPALMDDDNDRGDEESSDPTSMAQAFTEYRTSLGHLPVINRCSDRDC